MKKLVNIPKGERTIISLDVTDAIWLFVIVFMLHDFEEIISVEYWADKNKSKIIKNKSWIRKWIWNFWNVNSYSFAKRDVLIFLTMSGITILTVFNFTQPWSAKLYAAFLLFVLFHNALHILQTLILRGYTPGLYTAIFLVTPYTIFLLNLIG